MRKSFVCAIIALTAAVPAFGQEFFVNDVPHLLMNFPSGAPRDGLSPRNEGDAYDNMNTYSGTNALNGGAANVGANGITRLIADDISTTLAFPRVITRIDFCVANQNTVATNARVRLRLWFADGAGGLPGTYYNQGTPMPGNFGFTFNPILFDPGVSCFFFDPSAFTPMGTISGATLWAGETFDNSNGTTGAALADLNNLGVPIFNPPTQGSTAEGFFSTNAAGSFFGIANPAGGLQFPVDGGGNNLGWRFVPEPGTMALLGMGALALIRRRKA